MALRISRGGFFQVPSIKSRCLGEEARRGTPHGRPERDAPCLSAGTTATGASRRRVARCRARGGWSPACFARISPATPPTSSSRRCAIRTLTVLRPETDGTPLPGERCIIPFGSRPLSAGFWGFQSRRERPIASVGCIGRVRVVPRGPLGVVASPNPRVPGPDLTQKKRVSPRRRTRHRAPDYSREILTFRALRLRLRARRPPAMS